MGEILPRECRAMRLRGGVENTSAMHMHMHVKHRRQPFRLATQPACASVQSSCDPPLRLQLYLPRIQLHAAGRNLQQVMSTNSADRDGGASTGGGSTQLLVPRLQVTGYAGWRPAMENVLMRAGIAERDYREENSDWAALVAAVDAWARADESASIALALGRVSASASSKAGPSAAEKESRRGAMEAVARTRRAYTLLYQALGDDLRRLVAQVPQGYAYGLWSWLETRFQSTEQDSVGDLWDEFTQLLQGEDESFDEYKARVDRVYGLLAHAKDKPSPGLYAHRLLWKLSRRYSPAVLALKASGKLKVPGDINWDEVVAFVNNHERSAQRLEADDDDRQDQGRAMAATRGGRRGDGGDDNKGRGNALAGVVCYRCGERGHMARGCNRRDTRADERRRDRYGHGDEHDDEEATPGTATGDGQGRRREPREQASMATRPGGTAARGSDYDIDIGFDEEVQQCAYGLRAFTALTSDEENDSAGLEGGTRERGGGGHRGRWSRRGDGGLRK